jgi:hypothetical protein
MKTLGLLSYQSITAVVIIFSCASDLDYDQVNDIKVGARFYQALLAYLILLQMNLQESNKMSYLMPQQWMPT